MPLGQGGSLDYCPAICLFYQALSLELRYHSGPEKISIAVTSGFAEISNDRASILVEAAEKAIYIDFARAQRSMERALKRLGKKRDTKGIDFKRAEAALRRALARIKVAEKNGGHNP